MQKVTDALFSKKEATASLRQGFVTKCFLIFIVDEVKNFATNIFFWLVIKLHTEIHTIGQLRIGICTSKGRRSYIEEFRGFEAVEGFCCEFIYRNCRVQRQMFCTRSEISLYYSGLLFGKSSPQVFYYETSLFHWFSQVIISCLIYFSAT